MMFAQFGLVALVAAVSAYDVNYLEEKDLINHINSIESTWEAGPSKVFANHTLSEVSQMMGTVVNKHGPRTEYLQQTEQISFAAIPAEFDGRQKWNSCLHGIRDQQRCGSCWAFGASEALADRFCIAGHDIGRLSPQNLVGCDGSCMGCNGGTLDGAWNFMRDTGIVSDKCQPYISGDGTTRSCQAKCADGSQPKYYKAKTSYSVVSFWDKLMHKDVVSKIQTELMTNGPIEVAFTVYQDFMNYKSGVYEHKTGPVMGGHAVKLVGWGRDGEDNKLHWIIANSWGTVFGEQGYFRIRASTDECGIESNVYAGLPDLSTA